MRDEGRLFEVKKATHAYLSRMWEENYQKNLPYISKTPDVGKLNEKFKGMPAIVVGAGPSLDRNLRYLPHAAGKAVIICCDTALKILLRHSVTPDIVVNLDPQQTTMNFFEDVDTRNLTLVAPTIGFPALREKWGGNFFFYNKNAGDIPTLAKIAIKHPEVGMLTPGGSVLSIAFDLAFKSGADPIAFIGQDLGYTSNTVYAGGSHYEGYRTQELFDVHRENIIEETDLFGRKCKTQKSMAITKQWFAWAFKTWNPDGKRKFYNCSEAGILTDCPLTAFSEFISKYCTKKQNIGWAIKKAVKVKKF